MTFLFLPSSSFMKTSLRCSLSLFIQNHRTTSFSTSSSNPTAITTPSAENLTSRIADTSVMETPEYYYVHDTNEKVASADGEDFAVDDLLDLSNDDDIDADHGDFTVNTHAYGGRRCFQENGDRGGFHGSFNISGELCVPNDDVAELEWLSNFVEDSFSAKQPSLSVDFLPAACPSKAQTPDSSSTNDRTTRCPPPRIDSSSVFLPEQSPLRSKSRSKRPRSIPCDWTTRLPHLPTDDKLELPPHASSSKQDTATRRCLHCAAEKTPQWRTGPMGPKTLCNACGVRYKSGRLVPEYRPAASPTFVSARHSNSHRKVLELRRQKDMQRFHPHPLHPHTQHHSQFTGSSPTFISGDPESLIGSPGFRHVI